MHNYVAVVQDKPALLCLPLDATFFLMFQFCRLEHTLGQRVEHTVAGAVADHEIICKGCDVLNVEQQDVFTLPVFQRFDNFMSKIKCVQISPHILSLWRADDRRNNLIQVTMRFHRGEEPSSQGVTFLMVRNTAAYRPSRWVSSRSYISAPSLLWQCPASQSLSLPAHGGSSVARWQLRFA